ncbi:MAG: hypothetical protein AVO35_04445 [Candidatus Aegiribacteria sp. MLS_C]|nr:MAG: hypothetical protein AVO35_04445 [Candidatus Aegiribacteria sp. MLS_C]
MDGISVRKAGVDDLEAIAEISRLTWEGDDYLEGAAAEWIEDGTLYAGLWEGRVAGTFRISPMPCGVLWMEALRIHADLRGRGLGKQLAGSAFLIGTGMIQSGKGSCLEFSTYFGNRESIHISMAQGFEVVNRFLLIYSEGIDAGTGTAAPLSPGEVVFSEVTGHIPCGWKYPRACGPGMSWALENCEAWGFRGVGFLRRKGSDEATPVFGSREDPEAFLEGVEAAASCRGESRACIVLHESRTDLMDAARGRGYTTWEPADEYNVMVFRYSPGGV